MMVYVCVGGGAPRDWFMDVGMPVVTSKLTSSKRNECVTTKTIVSDYITNI